MTGAALPPLPSFREKELERTSAAIRTDEVDVADVSGDTPSTEQSATGNDPSALDSTDLPPVELSIAPSLSYAQRSEQLDLLHRKERKVFGGLPPLESSVAYSVIHQYISTTGAFLNSFIADANACHEGIDHKLTVLEKQMALLESKIGSMPDVFPEDDGSSHDVGGARGVEKEEGGIS